MQKKLFTRIMAVLIAVVLAVSGFPVGILPAQAAEEENLIYNGNFDLRYSNSQTVSGWNLNTKNTNHTAVIQSSVVYGTTGNALKIDATGQSYIWANDFSVESGVTYVVSYYIRVDRADGLQYAPFLNDSNYAGGWWKDFVLPAVTEAKGEWVKVSGTVTIPESVGANTGNPNSKVQLGFKVYQGSGLFYLDRVSFVKSPIRMDDPNLDFELQAGTEDGVQNWQSSDQTMTLENDSTVFHSGTRSMHVKKTTLHERDYVTSLVHIPVNAEAIYEFSFWMCSQNAQPTATVGMQLLPYAADGTRIQVDGQDATVYGSVSSLNGGSGRSDWTKVVSRAALPEGTAYVSLRFVLTRGAAEVWVDDIFFRIVEDGTDCVVYYEDFHAVDESGNISSWKLQGSGSFTAENGGKLTLTTEAGYIYDTMQCLMTDYTYCIKGNYSADIGGTVQVRFYDYQHRESMEDRKTVPLQAGGAVFAVNFTAPSHTYARLYIGSDQAGTIALDNVAIYMMAEPPQPDRNYLDADWTSRSDRDNVVSAVELHNGIPTLMIDGQPTASYFYQRPDLNAYLQTDAESRISSSGLELYVTYGGNLYKGGCNPIWLEDGSIDYHAFDAVIYDTLSASDEALVMVNIGMFAPKWWLSQNPDHQAQAYNGSAYIALEDASLASEKFRQEAGQVLRQLLCHMKEQNYYNRVFGIKISGGQSYEWMHLGTGADQGPDYSPASREGFLSYLRNKYGTDEALQAAWGNSQVTLATAAAPGWDERCASSHVYMGDAAKGSLSRNLVDWNLWLGEASADSFLYYCQIAKEVTDGKLIVGGYNGYLWTSNSYDSQGMAHTAMDRVLDSSYVDWIASPIAYNERLLGQSSTYMALLDSVQAHGKLYIAELDNRTCLAESYTGSWDGNWDFKIGQTRTMADTIYQQKRDFANALVNGAGLWQFDMYGGWLDDEQIYSYIRDAKAEYDLSVQLDRNTTNEVAVFVGDETYAYLTAENSNMSFKLLEPMLQQQRKHLAAMGAGYDTYAMSSLLEGKVPSHKLNIVLSPFEITEQMHQAINTYLKTKDQVVVWVYLPGISTGNQLSLSNVERATGFPVATVEKQSTLQIQIADSGHSLTAGLANTVYGNSTQKGVSPLPYISNTANMTVLGYHVDGGKPGFAVKDMGSWTSVYSAAPCLSVQMLRKLMEFAGCHSYSDNSADIIYSSNHYVALHSAAAGEKTIFLPGNYSVYDVFEEKYISMNTNVITYFHEANDTHIFRLMTPHTYPVTASIRAGKGTLSAPGLTQVTAGEGYSLTLKPEAGYILQGVTVNGAATQPDASGTLYFPAVQENTVIEVSFRKEILPDNRGFEYGSFGGGVTGSGTAAVVSDSNVHSGVCSLRVNHDGTARDLVEITIYLNAASSDRSMTISYWAKAAPSGVRALHNGAHFFTESWGSTGKSVYSAVYPSRTQWQKFTQELTVPAGTQIMQYQLYADTVNADVYIDDITMVCDGENRIINGTLERGNLTGSFTKFENTPQIIRSQLVHSGSYAARLSGTGTVTAELTDLCLEGDRILTLSAWLRGGASYRILGEGVLLAEGVWNGDSQWEKQTAVCNLPAETGSIQVQISAADSTAPIYLDDMDLSIQLPEAARLRFTEIYSDGTWRFTAENMDLFTENYYKIPVVIDGKEGYVIAHNVADMLCVYPDFFGVYGCTIPVVSLKIPENGILKAVDPAQGWGEKSGSRWIGAGQGSEVKLAEGQVRQWNVSLGGDLTVNFYADLQVEDMSAVEAVVTVADVSTCVSLSADQYDETLDAYCFCVHIAAAQMTDEISVQLLYKGVPMWEKAYTVQQYARSVLGDESMSSYHPLIRQMLNYGGKAQAYFDYRMDQPADEGISGAEEEEIPSSAAREMTVEGTAEGIKFYGVSLLFRHKVAVRYYFTASQPLTGYTFTVDGISYQAVKKDDRYYVELPGIYPQDWDAQIALTVCDPSGNSMTIYYSPMNYIVRMSEKGSDSLRKLVKAMYHYHLKAKALCTE